MVYSFYPIMFCANNIIWGATRPSVSKKHISLPFDSESHYLDCLSNLSLFRNFLAQTFDSHPELFPQDFASGFTFHDCYLSKKLNLKVRRIKLKASGEVFYLRPSFLFPYMISRTDEIEKALYLRQWGVPFDALAYVFGRDPMFWYRAWIRMGESNLVGTTVKSFEAMPLDLIADEKITWVCGKEVSLATTVAGGCFLGITAVEKDDTAGLLSGYGEFKKEVEEIFPQYHPRSVCTDGWKATREAWRLLYPKILMVLCYLHSVLKISERCRGERRREVLTKVWEVYKSENKQKFSQRVRRLKEWSMEKMEGAAQEMVMKLWKRRKEFLVAYECPQAARTSNGVDRLLNRVDRMLYAASYGHSNSEMMRKGVRAMALQWNFHPYGGRLRQSQATRKSPFADLNGYVYHENWLHNLLIASSMGGLRL